MSQSIAADLSRLIGEEHVLSGPAAERGYDCDAYTVDRSKPTVVVLPQDTLDVQKIVRYCLANDVPYTPRGAGTGLSGGALPALGGVLISTKNLTQILEVDVKNRCLLAQSGAVNKRLSDRVKPFGLHFAPDPSSQSVSTLGGNIAENAGGPHTLKYGVTVQHIHGLTMVEPGGEIWTFGGKLDGGPDTDYLGLIVGSEGTLGVVTEAWIKLTPVPDHVETALICFREIRDATQTVADIIASGTIPAALEMMDIGILQAVKLAFGLQYHADTQALLLVECDGEADQVRAEMAVVREVAERNRMLDIEVAADDAVRAKLWTARKKAVGAMGRLAPSIVTHDGVIPRSKLPEMLDEVYRIAARNKIGVANLFHAGDGNLHPCFYFDDRDPDQVRRVVEAGEEVIRLCLSLGGSVSGEHGIGVEKSDLMALMFDPDSLRLQADVKRVFNDGALCNPCKVLPNQKSCVEHRRRWRGVAT